MGDKVEARKLMAAAGVPVVPGSPGTLEMRLRFARSRRKSASHHAQGCRRRWRVDRLVDSDKDLGTDSAGVPSEAKSSFGDAAFTSRNSSQPAPYRDAGAGRFRATPSTSLSVSVRSSAATRKWSRITVARHAGNARADGRSGGAGGQSGNYCSGNDRVPPTPIAISTF